MNYPFPGDYFVEATPGAFVVAGIVPPSPADGQNAGTLADGRAWAKDMKLANFAAVAAVVRAVDAGDVLRYTPAEFAAAFSGDDPTPAE